MCWRNDLPEELTKIRKRLTISYSLFFVTSTIAFSLHFTYGFVSAIFTNRTYLGGNHKTYDLAACLLIIRYFSFGIIILYCIIEVWMLCFKHMYNLCTTIVFRAIIGMHDLTFAIITILDFKNGDEEFLRWLALSYLLSIIANFYLLFIITRFPRKRSCFSSNNFE